MLPVNAHNDIAEHLKDPIVKTQCVSDFHELELCMGQGAWKASCILAGSLIESLLYDAIGRDSSIPVKKKDFSKKKVALFDLLALSLEFNIINDGVFRFADQIRDYRNLIHPDVYVRKNIEINENIAKIGYSVLMEVLRLTKQHCTTHTSHQEEALVDQIIEETFNRSPTPAENRIYLPVIEKYGKRKGRMIVERALGFGNDKTNS